MLTALLISLVAVPAPAPASAPAVDPPVRVWLSRTDVVWPGDRIRVYAEAQGDGYLVVLHAEPDGRVRVLFPIDPSDDYFVRGGSRYEILSRGDREAITVYAEKGVGTVLAAFSRDPFRFDELAQGGHWDYRLPDAWWVNEDSESELLAVADRMAGGIPFDYDVQRYGVSQTVAAYRGVTGDAYVYPSYVYPASGVYLSAGFTFGAPFFAYSYASPVCWDWYYCYPGNWYYYSPYYAPYYGRYYYGPYGYYGYRPPYYYGYWHYPRYYYPSYPKYANKGPSYNPQGGGTDYRRRPGATAPTTRVGPFGGSAESGRRTTGATPSAPRASSPAGQSGRRTAPTPATPTAGGRRSAPEGAREAPARGDAGRRTTGSQPSGERTAPARPTREATPGRREAPAAAGEARRTVNRQSGGLPKRVYPTRGSVPSRREGTDQQATRGRAVESVRQPAGTRRIDASMPERVQPTRSVTMPQSSRRVVDGRSAAGPQRSTGSRAVSGRGASLPVRAPSGSARGAPRATAPRAAPPAARAAPRAPAGRASAPRAPAPRARPSGRTRH